MRTIIAITVLINMAANGSAQSKLVGVYKLKPELLRPGMVGELPDGGRFAVEYELKFHETVPFEARLITSKREREFKLVSKPKLPIRKFILPALLNVKLNYGRRKKREHRWEVYLDEDTGGVAMRSQMGVTMSVARNHILFLDLDHDGAFGSATDGYVVKPRGKKQWFKYGEELDVRMMPTPYNLEGHRIWLQVEPEGFKAIISSNQPDYGVKNSADHAAALAMLNAAREKLGFDPVVIDPALSDACQKHSLYCSEHGETDEEKKEKSGYTPEGDRSGRAAVMAEEKTMEAAVEYWLATFFKRVQMLHPGVMSVGMGAVNGHATMDVRTMRRTRRFEAYSWPYDGQEDVPLTWIKGEKPSPVFTDKFGDDAAQRYGYPITLTFPAGAVKDVKARLRTEEGQDIECVVTTPEEASNAEYANNLNTVFMTSRRPLKPSTKYLVSITCQHAGASFSRDFSFTTKAAD